MIYPNYYEKIIEIKRITKVIKGGKKLSFRTIVLFGNKNGSIGLGISKASDVTIALEKSFTKAKENLITLTLNENRSITIFTQLKYKTSSISIYPCKNLTGIKASNSIRALLDLSGFKHAIIKQHGSNNILNNLKAMFAFLIQFKN